VKTIVFFNTVLEIRKHCENIVPGICFEVIRIARETG
jgi:hypothetical protein